MGVAAGSEVRMAPDMLDLDAVEFEFIVSVNLSVGTEIAYFDFWDSVPKSNGLEEAFGFRTRDSCFGHVYCALGIKGRYILRTARSAQPSGAFERQAHRLSLLEPRPLECSKVSF